MGLLYLLPITVIKIHIVTVFMFTVDDISFILFHRFNIHGSVHRNMTLEITNKMQPCNRIYYSTVH